MAINPRVIAACEVVERMGVATSGDVSAALEIAVSTSCSVMLQAIMLGLVSANRKACPRQYRVTDEWQALKVTASPQPPVLQRDRILTALATPATSLQLAGQLGIGASTVRNNVKDLREAGLIYISGWVVGKTCQSAIYSLGQGETPEKPVLPGSERVLAALPGTVKQVCERVGMGRARVDAIMRELGDQIRVIGQSGPTGSRGGGLRPAIFDKNDGCAVREESPPDAYEFAAPIPKEPRTPWSGLELCRMGVRA